MKDCDLATILSYSFTLLQTNFAESAVEIYTLAAGAGTETKAQFITNAAVEL